MQNNWERIYRETRPGELPWEDANPSTELVALIESGKVEMGAVLDICCGSGNNAVYLARQGYTCHGIDISPTAIARAQRNAARERVSCELIAGNAIELPYPDNTFTLVFDRGCFHSIPPRDREAFIQGVFRVLKPAGKYLLICFSSKDHRSWGPPYSFSPSDIERYFSALFKIHHIKELPHDAHGYTQYFLSVLMEKPN